MDLHEAIRQEMLLLEQKRDSLCEKPAIKPYLEEVSSYIQKTQNREMTVMEKRNIAQCLDNAIMEGGIRQGQRLFENTTTEDHISFLGIQLPVISALLPSLTLNDVATVQALDRRIGAVFFMDFLSGSAKGEVGLGDTLFSSKSGPNAKGGARRYAMAAAEREEVGYGDTTFTSVTGINPGLILRDNIIVEATDSYGNVWEIGVCSSAGVITTSPNAGSGVTCVGSIATSGVYTIAVGGLLDSTTKVTITYYYQYDLPVDAQGNKTGVPEVDLTVTQETITAVDFPIRSKYSIGAQIDLQKAHGLSLEDELVKVLGGAVKWAIDQRGLDMMIAASTATGAATQCTTWDAHIHSGQAWLWHKYEFLDRLNEGSNNIFDKTKRGVANFMICGNNVARVVRQLTQGGDFKASAALGKQIPTGPLNIGNVSSVNNMVVIQNPFMDSNMYTLGFKGDSYLYASFIYAPYIPLFATPTLITSDLIAQKGFLSSAGFKVINPGLFCAGGISNLGV